MPDNFKASIFPELVEKYRPMFNTTSMYGTPISELDEDELKAVICRLGDDMKQKEESRSKEREMWKLFSGRK